MATQSIPLQNVTVNGMSIRQYLGKEKSDEVQKFLREELRAISRSTRRAA